MRRNIFSFIIAFFLITIMVSHVFAGAGRTGAQILELGGGTRAEALGEAFSAVSGDVTSIFWNPGGLANVEEIQTTLAYTDYSDIFGEASEGLYYALFAGAIPFSEYGAFGATLQVQGQGVIDVTTDSPEVIRQENLGTNWVLALSYADSISKNLYAGMTGKVIHQVLGDYGGNAYAVDFGAQYNLNLLPIPITFGTAIQNMGTRIKFKDEEQSDPLPRKCKIGTSWSFIDTEYHKFRIVADLTAAIDKLKEDDEEGIKLYLEEHPDVTREELEADRGVGINAFRWRNMTKSVGAEYWFGSILALRVGYKEEPGIVLQDFADHLTYGLGLRIMNYQVDYAATPGGGPDNKSLHTLALLLRF